MLETEHGGFSEKEMTKAATEPGFTNKKHPSVYKSRRILHLGAFICTSVNFHRIQTDGNISPLSPDNQNKIVKCALSSPRRTNGKPGQTRVAVMSIPRGDPRPETETGIFPFALFSCFSVLFRPRPIWTARSQKHGRAPKKKRKVKGAAHLAK